MSEAEKIIKDMPFVKDGLDNFYGHQTVLNALNQVLNLHLVSKRFWHFDTWDKNGKTETITIKALNEKNATIILKALHEDVAFDKPY